MFDSEKELIEYRTAQLIEFIKKERNITRAEALKLWYNSRTKKETIDRVEDYLSIEELYKELRLEISNLHYWSIKKSITMQRNEEGMLRALLLNCKPLLNYCQTNNLDIEKLKKADLIKLPHTYAFTRPSEFKLPEGAIGLNYDIETQPRPLLGVEVLEDGTISIVPTEYTNELKYDKTV